MMIGREELFRTMGLPRAPRQGESILLVSPSTGLRASVQWQDDELVADVTASIEWESGDAIISIDGIYLPDEDGFDLRCLDRRDEASDRRAPKSVANAFRMLTDGMTLVR